MKIVYIIAMLAVLTAAVPQQQNLSFARQLLQDIFTLQLVTQTQLNSSLSVNPFMTQLFADYQSNLYELNRSGTLAKFAELQSQLREYNTIGKDSGRKITEYLQLPLADIETRQK